MSLEGLYEHHFRRWLQSERGKRRAPADAIYADLSLLFAREAALLAQQGFRYGREGFNPSAEERAEAKRFRGYAAAAWARAKELAS